jgi:hypothetical protein
LHGRDWIAVQSNLATALKIPVEYIQAACRGEGIDTEQTNNVSANSQARQSGKNIAGL